MLMHPTQAAAETHAAQMRMMNPGRSFAVVDSRNPGGTPTMVRQRESTADKAARRERLAGPENFTGSNVAKRSGEGPYTIGDQVILPRRPGPSSISSRRLAEAGGRGGAGDPVHNSVVAAARQHFTEMRGTGSFDDVNNPHSHMAMAHAHAQAAESAQFRGDTRGAEEHRGRAAAEHAQAQALRAGSGAQTPTPTEYERRSAAHGAGQDPGRGASRAEKRRQVAQGIERGKAMGLYLGRTPAPAAGQGRGATVEHQSKGEAGGHAGGLPAPHHEGANVAQAQGLRHPESHAMTHAKHGPHPAEGTAHAGAAGTGHRGGRFITVAGRKLYGRARDAYLAKNK